MPVSRRKVAGQAPDLVVLTGEAGRDSTRVSLLLDQGAIIVIASTIDAVRAWLPDALFGGVRTGQPPVIVRVSRLEIDLTEHRARWVDRVLDLSEKEIRLLAALAEHPGRVWPFDELSQVVWGSSFYGGSQMIHSAVKRLRKKLAQAGADIAVESVRGVGFRLGKR